MREHYKPDRPRTPFWVNAIFAAAIGTGLAFLIATYL